MIVGVDRIVHWLIASDRNGGYTESQNASETTYSGKGNDELFAEDNMHSKAGQSAVSRATESDNASGGAGWPGKPGPKSGDQAGADRRGTPADEEMTERIRERAYQLWQAAGSPENRADDYWYEAETQVRAGVVPVKSGRA